MSIEIQEVPIICTSHLDEATGTTLAQLGNDNPWLPCAAWLYGCFLYIGAEFDANEEPPPKCLTDIKAWYEGLSHPSDKHGWVRLDCDAAEAEGLPTYDW